jgi:hypothetical protein
MSKQTTTEGYYLRTQVTPVRLQFTLPSTERGTAPSTTEEWFNSFVKRGGPAAANAGDQTAKGTKSTISSKWVNIWQMADEIANKTRMADAIYSSASDDPELTQRAEQKVADYKKNASKVLNAWYNAGKEPSQQMADEINSKSCLVYEVKIFLMKVSSQPIDGVTPSKKDGLYRKSVCVRKFYIETQPLTSLLDTFTEMIGEVGTNVDAVYKLQFVRQDGVTPRTGRNAGYAHFKIVSTNDPGSLSDQALSDLVGKLRLAMSNS